MEEKYYRILLRDVYNDIISKPISRIVNINTAVEIDRGNIIMFEAKFKVIIGDNPIPGADPDKFIKNINVIEYNIYEYDFRDDGFAEPIEGFDINEFVNDLISISI